MGSFVFRWPYPADDVHVTGTFDDWGKTEVLHRVGDHWEKEVDLPSADQTYFYKFVVDNQWIVDDAAPKQDDGHWNVNNVLTPDKITRKAKEITHSTPGAFPEDSESYGVQPIPATSGAGNPVSIPAGEKLPEHKDITTNTIGSNVTTSKEDYENSGNDSFPTSSTKETESYSINPIPATSGAGNPVSIPAGEKLPEHKDITTNTIDSNVTTSKEDYENSGNDSFPTSGTKEAESYSINPIPASSGIGNPISVPAGEKLPPHEEATGSTVDSNITTSKEHYEKSGSSFTGAGIATGAAAGLAGVGAAGAAAFKKSDTKQNLIPESSLPMGSAATNTLDAGPFISSSGPNTTATELASKVPLEPKREAAVVDSMGSSPFISSAGAGTTTSDLAAKVPLEKKRQAMIVDPLDAPSVAPTAASVPKTVQESISESFQAPEAAASTEAVKEKTDMEKELLSKTERTEAIGEPASAAKQQTSYYGLATSVPKPVETSMQKASASPEAAAETSVVAEKTAMEKELLSKVSSTNEAGEPAPTITSSTSAIAPTTSATTTTENAAGVAPTAAAAVSDGAADEPDLKAPKITAPIEKSEAATTEYAPVRTDGAAPGVSSAAAAALSDGTEDPTLADEPAVRMMNDNAAGETVHDTTTSASAAKTTGASTGIITGETAHDATTSVLPATTTTGSTTTSVLPATTTTGSTTTSVLPATTTTGSTTTSAQAVPTATKTSASSGVPTGVSSGVPTGAATTGGSAPATDLVSGVPTITSAGTTDTKATEKKATGLTSTSTGPSAPSTPAKKVATSGSAVSSPASSTATKEKKKRHRLSAFFHKIID